MRRPAVALAALLLTAVAGCTSAATHGSADHANPGDAASVPSSGKALAVGEGPKGSYTVQAQPAPGSCHFRYEQGQPLPDPTCTPGAVSPAVTQANLSRTICRKGGYTSDIRPPASITGREKKANAKSYGYTGSLADAEYDHLISLQLGGDPNDPRNLWVEPPSPGHKHGQGVNNPKDSVETHLHTAICAGKVTLAAAQQAIATDWTTAEQRLGLGQASSLPSVDSSPVE
ncbi:hypothetical protein [Streptacidiphilus monticola]|uniref:HNH endonuclease n=1 Tax=Streptacidiphilus monticola TaxID=2161674 RepID=A0ABW1G267_9ACTN